MGSLSYRNVSAGGVLVMMLVLFSMLMVIMIAVISYINRQFHDTVDQEQREKIFHVAESGVDYTVAALNIGTDPSGLVDGPVSMYDPGTSDLTGVFDVSYFVISDGVRVESVGYDASGAGMCEKVAANIQRVGVSRLYAVTLWDRDVSCP